MWDMGGCGGETSLRLSGASGEDTRVGWGDRQHLQWPLGRHTSLLRASAGTAEGTRCFPLAVPPSLEPRVAWGTGTQVRAWNPLSS